MRFRDKTVLITGASAGVGAAAARRFFAEGARLVLAARGQDKLDALAAELGDADRVHTVAADVGRIADCEMLVRAALERFDGLDVLVNNAGCNHRGAVEEVEAGQLAQIIDVNLRAPVLLSRLALPSLRAARGAIVNVASIAGRVPLPHEAAYSATKFGLRAFSFAMHEELRDAGVRVCAVSPGPIETGFILEDIDSVPDMVFSQPMSTADEIAGAVVDCAADGRRERVLPASSGKLATFAYLFPAMRRVLAPALEKKGRAAKARYRARAGV